MFSQKKQETERERLDRLGQEALRAVRMSEAEIAAVAETEDLYARLRRRIAATERQRAHGSQQPSSWWARLIAPVGPEELSAWRRPWWPLTAVVALLVLLALIVPRWLQVPTPEPPLVTVHSPSPTVKTDSVAANSKLAPEPQDKQQSMNLATNPATKSATSAVTLASSSKPERRTPRPRGVRDSDLETEKATEFIPLMYWPDASGHESARVVRIKVPRATLVSFGLPMNAERAGELVKADVVLGDDGLARAIRFIY